MLNKTSSYQRPYKSRHHRREIARRKHDESSDKKFLRRAVGVICVLIVVALTFAFKGMADKPDDFSVRQSQNPVSGSE